MSLSGSMWTSVSGLLSHSEKMNVIGNNIANVNTVGFKGQRMDFSDFVYANSYNSSGLNQVGLGVTPQTIISSFTQGAFESTTNPTDLAINGSGFFQVGHPNNDQVFYTRAGNFNFDKDGYLTDPNGFILQGWKIDNSGGVTRSSGGLAANASNGSSSPIVGTGVPTDIKLDAWTVAPFATTFMSFIPNLSSDQGMDNSVNTSNPFTALFQQWDGTQPPASPNTPPITEAAYSYPMTMKVYDEAGTAHTITIYFDKVDSNDYKGGEDGGSMWEYIITMDPSEDKRQYWEEDPRMADGGQLVQMSSTAMAGMLGAGTIEFNSAGQAINQSTYTFLGAGTPEDTPGDYTQVDNGKGELVWVPSLSSGWYVNENYTGTNPDPDHSDNQRYLYNDSINQNPQDLDMWRAADVSADGYPIIVANFTGKLGAQTSGSPDATSHSIEMTFGLKASNTDQPWTSSNASLADLSVDPYLYNPNYNPLNPAYGPQYYLVNPNYSATSMGKINEIIKDLESDWDNLGFTKDDPNNPGTDIALTFDEWFEYYGTQPDLDTALGIITGSKLNAAAGATAQAEALAIVVPALNKLTDPNNSTVAGKSLMDTAFQYQFKDSLGTAELMTPSSGTPIDATHVAYDPAAPNLTAATIPLITSEAMKYVISYHVDGSTRVDRSGFVGTEPADANLIASFNDPIRESSSIQSNAGSSATYSQSQNGYSFGNLSAYYVDQDGILSGVYSNGVTLGLYQITMYDFVSSQNLKREGGNLFSQTIDSGEPKSGPAGVAGLGTIISETIEMSNVDLAREFVLMITTQRGFQGNSKMVTTIDGMLDTVINMKR